jgi:hypothetical protein
MSWWSWLLLGAFGPYALAAILWIDYEVMAAYRKSVRHVSYKWDKPLKMVIIFRGKNKTLWTMTKEAGSNRVNNQSHGTGDMDSAVELARNFFSELVPALSQEDAT